MRPLIATALGIALLLLASPARAQWRIEGGALVGRAEHRVDAGFGVATSSGTMLGVRAVVGRGMIEAEVRALGGRLGADSVARDDRRMGEVTARVSVLPIPWLALHGAATLRSFDLAPAVQRWTALGAGAELRLAFAGEGLEGLVRATLLPHVAASGVSSPDLGIASAAGLRMTRGRIVAGLEYALERYAFPDDATTGRRREQLSGVTLMAGAVW